MGLVMCALLPVFSAGVYAKEAQKAGTDVQIIVEGNHSNEDSQSKESKPGSGSGSDSPGKKGSSGSNGSGSNSAGGDSTAKNGGTHNDADSDKETYRASGRDNSEKAETTEKGGKKQAENREQKTAQYSGYVDIALNVTRSDGTPAAGLGVELHSKIKAGTLDSNGFILIPEVEAGSHVVYVKNDDGDTLAKKVFTISRSSVTNLEADDVVTVGAMTAQITLNVEFDEGSGVKLVSAWEGITDRNGSPISDKKAAKPAAAESSPFQKIIKQPRLWLTIILLLILLIALRYLGKRGRNRDKEADSYEYKTAWKE